MRSSIVCGIDGSEESVFAAKVAASLAGALERNLVLAHAMQDPPTFPYDDTWSREVQRKRASEEGTWLLERVAAELPGEEPELRVLFGDPIESLGIVCGDDVELLVLGTRGRSRLAGALLRSVSAHLGSAARCPVIVVPPGAHERFLQPDRSGSSIVCGIDGSAEAGRALSVAAGLAAAMDLQLRPVVVDAGRPSEDPDGDESTRSVVRSRDPAQALRAHALGSDARLIAVGSRGRNALRAALFGSVSGELAATAPLPVLVVPRRRDRGVHDGRLRPRPRRSGIVALLGSQGCDRARPNSCCSAHRRRSVATSAQQSNCTRSSATTAPR